MAELSKAYLPGEVEEKWYAQWQQAGCFTADAASAKPAYSIVIPPPNVTGILHLGHVLNNTLQDILARRADAPVRAVIERLSGYARDLYRQAWPGFALLSGTGRAAVGMGTLVFRSYLDELERRRFDSVTAAIKPSGVRRLWAIATNWPALMVPDKTR